MNDSNVSPNLGHLSVGVVISTYNRPKALNLVLQGLSLQTIQPDQIVIGDDGSGYQTKEVITHWQFNGLPIEHVWQEDSGFRKTIVMNRAIAKVKTSYLIFLDGDCVPLESFVQDHLAHAESRYVLAGTRILASAQFTKNLEAGLEDCHGQTSWYWLKKKLTGATNQWFPLLKLPDGSWRKFRSDDWGLVRGCNFSIFTEDLIRVGGFDETILGWGREDSELAIRLINSGVQVKSLNCTAPVLHLWHREESRNRLAENDTLLQQTIAEHRTMARVGLQSSADSEI